MAPHLSTSRFGWLALSAAVLASPIVAPAQEGTPFAKPPEQAAAAAAAAAKPAGGNLLDPPRGSMRDADSTKLLDFLMKEYKALLGKTKDRLGRSLALVCLNQVPRPDATAELLGVLKSDRDPLVKMVAWQAILSRANGLKESEFKEWVKLTPPLVQAGAFRGHLRVPMLQVLALVPPDAAAKEVFSKIFKETNSTDPEDVPTILALGETMRAWGETSAAEAVLGRMSDLNDAYRAEMVIRAAGAGNSVPMASNNRGLGSDAMWKQAQKEYAAWWAQEKGNWKPLKYQAESGEWTKLTPQYIAKVDLAAAIDPKDKKWYRDLELRVPTLKTFSVGLLVDTTGSMGKVLEWLRADTKRMLQAFGIIALEPQITLTFYRDHGDAYVTQTLPLTGKYDTLIKALNATDAKGGADIPEAVKDALKDSLANGKWPQGKSAPKAMVLIGDAPPHANTVDDCVQIVKDAVAQGFRLYTVKTMTGYEGELSSFDTLANAGNGASLWSDMRAARNAAMHGYVAGRTGGLGMGFQGQLGGGAPAASTRDETEDDGSDASPGEWIVTRVVTDSVAKQYATRVRPPVAILWQMLKEPMPETHKPFPPAPPRDSNMPGNNPGGMNKPPEKPKDPQAR